MKPDNFDLPLWKFKADEVSLVFLYQSLKIY